MSFQQIYYTSCQQGLRGGKGFQINAATEGINPSVLQQVERLGLYVPPVSAPSRPTEEEIRRFPVSLIFQRLGDGTAVIAQAKYTGADYSGRFGNYFTHTLIPADPERDLREEGPLPIELWGASMWSTIESLTTTLPALGRLEAGGVIAPERVAEFLSEGGRMSRLPAYLTAVQGALTTKRRIVMVEESQSVALWIAAASYALPRHLALTLTFSTYSKNPYQSDFLLVGTTSDSDFGFAPHEIEHQFYVFDFAGDRFTPVDEITPFARMVSAAYAAGQAHAVAEFGAFIERAAPDLRLDEMGAAFACHARRRGLDLPGADDARVLEWCAARLGGLEAPEVRDIVAPVTGRGDARVEILDAFTGLYLAALHDSIPAEMRKQVELPYLEWLVKTASKGAPLAALGAAAERLRVRPEAVAEVSSLILPWIRQVRQCAEATRLPALFEVADRLGFFDGAEDSLRLIGEEVIGPALSRPPVGQILERLAGKPGMRGIISGAGQYLASQVGSPEAFRPLAGLLSHKEIYQAFVRYAFEQRSVALFFRLVGARLPHVPAYPAQRLEAFNECLAGLRMIEPSLPGELVDNAYYAVWQSALPSFDEADGLLDILEGLRITGTDIPKHLVDLVATYDLTALAQWQQELVNRLGARGAFYKTLGAKGMIIDAYRIPAELESSGEELPEEIEATLKFLEDHPELGGGIIATAYAVVAAHLVRVKDRDRHARLLVRAYEHAGDRFLNAYGRTVAAALDKPSNTRPKVTARFVQIWTSVEQAGARFVAAALFDQFLPVAVAKWRSREMESVEGELGGDPPALRRWLVSREAAKAQDGRGGKGFFGRFAPFGRGERGKR
jgi:hypothetical protein